MSNETEKDLAQEKEVFEQEVSTDEIEAVAGGDCERVQARCTVETIRWIYENSFPDCAATVEDGSWCYESDACYGEAILYYGMTECHKAWK